jgi:acyl-CoA synthetase (AMP-forming)/AMP-acid ligase II
MLVHQFAEYYARNFPGNPCVTQGDDTCSYGEVNALANRLANGLLAAGVSHGERVAVIGENSLEHILLFLAAGKIGAVTVSLNYRLAPAELSYIINDAGAKALLVLDDGMLDTLAALRDDLPQGITVLTRTGSDGPAWDTWLASHSDAPPAVTVDEDAAFLQMYTSGTTGHPKGVVVNHRSVCTQMTMNTTLMPHRPDVGSANVVCAPLFHIGGAGSVLGGLFAGIQIILHKTFDPVAVIEDIERCPVEGIFMVPAMIMAVLNLPDIEKRDFSGLKQIYYGASPISASVLARAIEVFDARFVQMYGMTETCGTVVNLSPADHDRALAGEPDLLQSCGRPSVGVEIRIMDTAGREVPNGDVGEIWVHASCNMQGYHNLPEETAKNLTDGWVHTGDAGTRDDEGFIYLKDRIKDMVVSGGENIYPVEVENALAHHEAIVDVAIIGVPDEKFGEALLAFVVLKPGAELGVEEMISFCRDKIAGYKIPRLLEILEEMPRNPSGKILKKELRKPYWEGVNRNIG